MTGDDERAGLRADSARLAAPLASHGIGPRRTTRRQVIPPLQWRGYPAGAGPCWLRLCAWPAMHLARICFHARSAGPACFASRGGLLIVGFTLSGPCAGTSAWPGRVSGSARCRSIKGRPRFPPIQLQPARPRA